MVFFSLQAMLKAISGFASGTEQFYTVALRGGSD